MNHNSFMTKGGVKGAQGFQRGGRVKDFKGGSMVSRGVQRFQRGVKDFRRGGRGEMEGKRRDRIKSISHT